jgi:hypothetical protein
VGNIQGLHPRPSVKSVVGIEWLLFEIAMSTG